MRKELTFRKFLEFRSPKKISSPEAQALMAVVNNYDIVRDSDGGYELDAETEINPLDEVLYREQSDMSIFSQHLLFIKRYLDLQIYKHFGLSIKEYMSLSMVELDIITSEAELYIRREIEIQTKQQMEAEKGFKQDET